MRTRFCLTARKPAQGSRPRWRRRAARLLLTSGAAAALSSVCAGSWELQPGEDSFGVEAQGILRYGPVSGFVQTPNGGAPGTTSARRPTLHELGMDDLLSPEFSFHAGYRGNILYGGVSLVTLGEEATLSRQLLTHGTLFPAGAEVTSDLQLTWYRAGYQRQFVFATSSGQRVVLAPGAGAALFDFDYRLKAANGPSTRRAYTVGTPQLSLETEWLPGGRFSVAAGVFSSLPGVANLSILSAQITGQYRLWGNPRRGGRLFLGVGGEFLDYEDSQRVPNHVKADLGPLLIFGLRASF